MKSSFGVVPLLRLVRLQIDPDGCCLILTRLSYAPIVVIDWLHCPQLKSRLYVWSYERLMTEGWVPMSWGSRLCVKVT